MITRYNRKWEAPVIHSCPVKEEYELVTLIEPISFNDDKTIKEYKEVTKYVIRKSKWDDFIESFDIGSISEQVMNHITKGTPLITAHSLPAGDYTPENLLKGAEVQREMRSKGITLEMIVDALNQVSTSNDNLKDGGDK